MNEMWWFAASVLLFLGIAGCEGGDGATSGSGGPAGDALTIAQADLQPSAGQTVTGSATFTSGGTLVTLVLTLEGLTPNAEHAVHIHEQPDCGMDGMNATGHWDPTNEAHGKWAMGAYHRGDIGNVTMDGTGKATLTMTTDEWVVSSGDVTKDV